MTGTAAAGLSVRSAADGKGATVQARTAFLSHRSTKEDLHIPASAPVEAVGSKLRRECIASHEAPFQLFIVFIILM